MHAANVVLVRGSERAAAEAEAEADRLREEEHKCAGFALVRLL